MTNIVNKIIAYFMAYRAGDLTKVLSLFDKVQARLDTYVAMAERDLESIQAAIDAGVTRRDAKNADLDRALRASHNLSMLVK